MKTKIKKLAILTMFVGAIIITPLFAEAAIYTPTRPEIPHVDNHNGLSYNSFNNFTDGADCSFANPANCIEFPKLKYQDKAKEHEFMLMTDCDLGDECQNPFFVNDKQADGKRQYFDDLLNYYQEAPNGDRMKFMVYFHNNADDPTTPNNIGAIAKDVEVGIELPEKGLELHPKGFIDTPHTGVGEEFLAKYKDHQGNIIKDSSGNTLRKITDDVRITSQEPLDLTVIQDEIKLVMIDKDQDGFHFGGTVGPCSYGANGEIIYPATQKTNINGLDMRFCLDTKKTSSKKATVRFDQIPGCFDYTGFLYFNVKAKKDLTPCTELKAYSNPDPIKVGEEAFLSVGGKRGEIPMGEQEFVNWSATSGKFLLQVFAGFIPDANGQPKAMYSTLAEGSELKNIPVKLKPDVLLKFIPDQAGTEVITVDYQGLDPTNQCIDHIDVVKEPDLNYCTNLGLTADKNPIPLGNEETKLSITPEFKTGAIPRGTKYQWQSVAGGFFYTKDAAGNKSAQSNPLITTATEVYFSGATDAEKAVSVRVATDQVTADQCYEQLFTEKPFIPVCSKLDVTVNSNDGSPYFTDEELTISAVAKDQFGNTMYGDIEYDSNAGGKFSSSFYPQRPKNPLTVADKGDTPTNESTVGFKDAITSGHINVKFKNDPLNICSQKIYIAEAQCKELTLDPSGPFKEGHTPKTLTVAAVDTNGKAMSGPFLWKSTTGATFQDVECLSTPESCPKKTELITNGYSVVFEGGTAALKAISVERLIIDYVFDRKAEIPKKPVRLLDLEETVEKEGYKTRPGRVLAPIDTTSLPTIEMPLDIDFSKLPNLTDIEIPKLDFPPVSELPSSLPPVSAGPGPGFSLPSFSTLSLDNEFETLAISVFDETAVLDGITVEDGTNLVNPAKQPSLDGLVNAAKTGTPDINDFWVNPNAPQNLVIEPALIIPSQVGLLPAPIDGGLPNPPVKPNPPIGGDGEPGGICIAYADIIKDNNLCTSLDMIVDPAPYNPSQTVNITLQGEYGDYTGGFIITAYKGDSEDLATGVFDFGQRGAPSNPLTIPDPSVKITYTGGEAGDRIKIVPAVEEGVQRACRDEITHTPDLECKYITLETEPTPFDPTTDTALTVGGDLGGYTGTITYTAYTPAGEAGENDDTLSKGSFYIADAGGAPRASANPLTVTGASVKVHFENGEAGDYMKVHATDSLNRACQAKVTSTVPAVCEDISLSTSNCLEIINNEGKFTATVNGSYTGEVQFTSTGQGVCTADGPITDTDKTVEVTCTGITNSCSINAVVPGFEEECTASIGSNVCQSIDVTPTKCEDIIANDNKISVKVNGNYTGDVSFIGSDNIVCTPDGQITDTDKTVEATCTGIVRNCSIDVVVPGFENQCKVSITPPGGGGGGGPGCIGSCGTSGVLKVVPKVFKQVRNITNGKVGEFRDYINVSAKDKELEYQITINIAEKGGKLAQFVMWDTISKAINPTGITGPLNGKINYIPGSFEIFTVEEPFTEKEKNFNNLSGNPLPECSTYKVMQKKKEREGTCYAGDFASAVPFSTTKYGYENADYFTIKNIKKSDEVIVIRYRASINSIDEDFCKTPQAKAKKCGESFENTLDYRFKHEADRSFNALKYGDEQKARVVAVCPYLLTQAAGDIYFEKQFGKGITSDIGQCSPIKSTPGVIFTPEEPDKPEIPKTGPCSSQELFGTLVPENELSPTQIDELNTCLQEQAQQLAFPTHAACALSNEENSGNLSGLQNPIDELSSSVCETKARVSDLWRWDFIKAAIKENKDKFSKWNNNIDIDTITTFTQLANAENKQSGIFKRVGDLTLGNGAVLKLSEIGGNTASLIIVEGDLYIKENIEYDDHKVEIGVASPKDFPSVATIVFGNIHIAENVDHIDGIYMALQNKEETGGFIYGEESEKQLNIVGSIIGDMQDLLVKRSFTGDYSAAGGNVVIHYSERVHLNTPPGLNDWLDMSIFKQKFGLDEI